MHSILHCECILGVFFAPVNQMVHNGPNVTEWYTVLHHELKTVHNLAHEI